MDIGDVLVAFGKFCFTMMVIVGAVWDDKDNHKAGRSGQRSLYAGFSGFGGGGCGGGGGGSGGGNGGC